jgi:hypothetical protein
MMYNQSFAVGQNVVTDCGCYAMDENDKEHYVEESCAGVVVEVGNDEDPVCYECEAQGSTQYLPCPAHPHSPLEESLRLEG